MKKMCDELKNSFNFDAIGGQFAKDVIAKRVLQSSYWWPILFKDYVD